MQAHHCNKRRPGIHLRKLRIFTFAKELPEASSCEHVTAAIALAYVRVDETGGICSKTVSSPSLAFTALSLPSRAQRF